MAKNAMTRRVMPKRASTRFMLTYFAFFACLLMILIPAHSKTIDIFTDNILQDSYTQMVNGIHDLETDVSNLTTLAQSFYSSTRFSSLSYLRAPFSAQEMYAMEQARLELVRYMRTLSMVQDFGLIYGNGVVLTTQRIHTQPNEFYGPYFQCGALALDSWLDRIRSASFDGLLVEAEHWSYDHGNYMALTLARTLPLASDIGAKTLVWANLETEYVVSRIVNPDILGNGVLRLYDCTGRLLLQSGLTDAAIPKMETLHFKSETTGLSVALELPRALVDQRLASLTRLYWLYGLLIAGIGVALSIIFAYRNSKPVRDIVRIIDGKGLQPVPTPDIQEDFGFIQQSIHHMDKQLTQAQEHLLRQEATIRANAILRLMHGLVYTQKEWREAQSMFPDFPASYRLCHVRANMPGTPEMAAHALLLTGALERHFPHSEVFSVSELEHIAIVSPSSAADSLERVAQDMQNDLGSHGIETRYAFSSAHSGLQDLSAAYAQTAHIFRLYGDAPEHAICFHDNLPEGSLWLPAEFADSERFYRLLLACERQGAMAVIDKTYQAIIASGYANNLAVQHAYLSLLLVLERIDREFFHNHTPPLEVPTYSPHASLDTLFEEIRKTSQVACDFFEQSAQEQSQAQTKRILQYVDANLADPEIHARAVAACFSMTESSLQKHIRAATGKTFYEYLDGQRMALAVSLLKTSSLPIQEIALKTGFLSHNSFYKAFRRSQGMPPSALR